MPDLSLKGVRKPDLHLPEMSRDDIARALDGARRDVDLARFDPRRFEMPDIDLSKLDVPAAVTSAARSAGLVKQRRSRAPLIVGGLIVAALVAIAAAMSPAIRPKLDAAGRRLRAAVQERRDAMRDDDPFDESDEVGEARAFDAAVAVPIEPTAYSADAPADGSPFDGASELPDGLGADVERQDVTAGATDGGSRS
ncbi:MAG: hypothetical protein ACLGIJ_08130 [Candidatus Limnocylindria bacterium]